MFELKYPRKSASSEEALFAMHDISFSEAVVAIGSG